MDFTIPAEHQPEYSDSLTIGSKYDPVESAVYSECTVTAAYLLQDTENNLVKQVMEYEVNGAEVSETFTVMKDGKQTAPDKKTGKDTLLWGRRLAAEVNFLIAGIDIDALTKTKKVIQLYDFSKGGKADTTVVELAELIGKPIDLAILKIRKNKMIKQGTKFVNTPEEKFINQIKKHARHSDGKTMAEIKAQTPAEFMAEWQNTYKGKTLDQYKPVAGSPAPNSANTGSATQNAPWDSAGSASESVSADDDPFA